MTRAASPQPPDLVLRLWGRLVQLCLLGGALALALGLGISSQRRPLCWLGVALLCATVPLRRLLTAYHRWWSDNHRNAPIVKLVNLILVDAIKKGATEIRLEPKPDCVSVEYKMGGAFRQHMRMPPRLGPAVRRRLKRMAKYGPDGQGERFWLAFSGATQAQLSVLATPAPEGEKLLVLVRRP